MTLRGGRRPAGRAAIRCVAGRGGALQQPSPLQGPAARQTTSFSPMTRICFLSFGPDRVYKGTQIASDHRHLVAVARTWSISTRSARHRSKPASSGTHGRSINSVVLLQEREQVLVEDRSYYSESVLRAFSHPVVAFTKSPQGPVFTNEFAPAMTNHESPSLAGFDLCPGDAWRRCRSERDCATITKRAAKSSGTVIKPAALRTRASLLRFTTGRPPPALAVRVERSTTVVCSPAMCGSPLPKRPRAPRSRGPATVWPAGRLARGSPRPHMDPLGF